MCPQVLWDFSFQEVKLNSLCLEGGLCYQTELGRNECVSSKLGNRRHHGFLAALSQFSCVMRPLTQTPWRGPCDKEPRPPTNSHVNGAILKVPALLKPSDAWSSNRQLNWNPHQILSQNHRAKSFQDCWSSDDYVRYQICCFMLLSFRGNLLPSNR